MENEPQIISPDEARGTMYGPDWKWGGTPEQASASAFTAAVLGDQVAAIRVLWEQWREYDDGPTLPWRMIRDFDAALEMEPAVTE